MYAFIEGFFGLFVFGAFGFWALLFIISCILIGLVEAENGLWATGVFIFTLAFVAFAVKLSVHVITDHPLMTILYLLGYFAIGALWAIVKWWRFVVYLVEKYKEIRKEFLRDHDILGFTIPDNFKDKWFKHLENNYGRNGYRSLGMSFTEKGLKPPDPSNHKERIYSWITFWPWSLLWFILDEPVRKIAKAIYNGIYNFLVKISEAALRNTVADFKRDVEPATEAKAGDPSTKA